MSEYVFVWLINYILNAGSNRAVGNLESLPYCRKKGTLCRLLQTSPVPGAEAAVKKVEA